MHLFLIYIQLYSFFFIIIRNHFYSNSLKINILHKNLPVLFEFNNNNFCVYQLNFRYYLLFCVLTIYPRLMKYLNSLFKFLCTNFFLYTNPAIKFLIEPFFLYSNLITDAVLFFLNFQHQDFMTSLYIPIINGFNQ